MDENTFIFLWRSLLADGWFMALTEKQKWAWIALLLQVNYAPSEYYCRKCQREFKMPKGSTAKTYRTLASTAGVGEHVMRGLLEKAVRKGNLSVMSKEPCHVLYVVENWEKYQGSVATRSQHRRNTVATPSQEEERNKGTREEGKNQHRVISQQKALFTSPSISGDEPSPQGKKKASKPAKRADWQRVLDVYYQDREQLDGKGPQLDWRTKDKAVAQSLLKGPPVWTVEELAPLIRKYNRMDDDYVREAGYPWAMFPKKINKLRIGRNAGPSNGSGPFKPPKE